MKALKAHWQATGHSSNAPPDYAFSPPPFSEAEAAPSYKPVKPTKPAKPPKQKAPPAEPKCNECHERFATFHELAGHRRTIHGKVPLVEIKCERCAQKIPWGEVHTSCSPPARVSCSVCHQRFSSAAELTEHRLANILSCEICAVHLPPSMSLQDHWRVSNQHPYCKMCDNAFRDSRMWVAGSPADALAAVSQWPDGDDEDYLGKKLWLARPLEILEADRDEMCVDVVLCKGGKRWTRYQFSCIPPDAVLLFREQVLIEDSVENAARVVRSAPQHSALARHGNVAIARNHIYYTETAVTLAAGAARRAPPPLWFFVLKHDGAERGAAPSRRTPCGFWSVKKNPTRIPPGVVYHRTPQYEHITGTCVVPLSTWTQTIGDFVFTTQTKMRTQCLVLGEDEMEALSSLREDRFSFSPRDSFFGDPDDGTLRSPPTQRV